MDATEVCMMRENAGEYHRSQRDGKILVIFFNMKLLHCLPPICIIKFIRYIYNINGYIYMYIWETICSNRIFRRDIVSEYALYVYIAPLIYIALCCGSRLLNQCHIWQPGHNNTAFLNAFLNTRDWKSIPVLYVGEQWLHVFNIEQWIMRLSQIPRQQVSVMWNTQHILSMVIFTFLPLICDESMYLKTCWGWVE